MNVAQKKTLAMRVDTDKSGGLNSVMSITTHYRTQIGLS